MSNLVLDSGYQVTPEIIASLKTSQGVREWLSQPRPMTDRTTEVILLRFRSPVYINYIRFDLLQISQNYQLVYLDENGQEQLVLDRGLSPVRGALAFGEVTKYYTVEWEIYPILASAISLRMKRVVSPSYNIQTAVSLGVQNLLCERRIDTRQDAEGPFPVNTDSLGNIVERVVKDWDPSQALDGNSGTYWKSEPQPDPSAVVWFAADIRDVNGNAQKIDRFYVDPVHSGQTMTCYSSSDDTTGTRTLSNSVIPFSFSDAAYTQGSGWLDTNNAHLGSTYQTSAFGLNDKSSFWIGTTIVPQYASSSPPSGTDRIVWSSQSNNISLIQRAANGAFAVTVGATTVQTGAIGFNANTELRVAVRFVLTDAIGQTPLGIYIDVFNSTGGRLASYAPTSNLSLNMPVFGSFTMHYYQSITKNVIIKQQTGRNSDVALWGSNPVTYLSPKPVLASSQGKLPSTTLDNVIFGQDFTQFELPRGGLDGNFFAEKLWVPIIKSYKVSKGVFYLPKPVNAKYIKLEFTNLTSEPYTIWRDGVKVQYQTYPVWVDQIFKAIAPTSNNTGVSYSASPTTFNGLSLNNVGSPVANPKLYTVEVNATPNAGPIRNTVTNPVVNQFSQEKGNASVYKMTGATATTSAIVANAKISGATNVLSSDNISSAPTRDANWWVLPGQQQRIPAVTMQNIAAGETVTSIPNPALSVFFPITCVHRYDIKTVTRDKAIAYFAGLNEFKVYRQNYGVASDTEEYIVHSYDAVDFSFTNAIPNSTTGATLPVALPATIVNSTTWNSTSTFQKVQFNAIDRGLHTLTGGINNVSAISVGGGSSDTATWDDKSAKWDDSVITWGATAPIVNVSLQSNYYYNGITAAQMVRQAVAGDSEVTTQSFSLPANTRIQLGAKVFPTVNSGNTYSLRLVDLSNSNVILYQSTVNPLVNQWNDISSLFYSDTTAHTNVAIQFVASGSAADTIYLGDLFGNATSIVYQISNDNGAHYYEMTNVVNQAEGFFMLPTANNQLMVKTTMYDINDYVYGFELTPFYLK